MSRSLLSYEEAANLVCGYAEQARQLKPAVERVELARAQGRILARPLHADRDQPPFARSTRDGFACRAREASLHTPLTIAGSTRAGLPPGGPLSIGAAWEIMTGAPIPAGADAVMMLEHVESGVGTVRLLPPRVLRSGENIVAQGAQANAGDELLPAGVSMGAGQIALAASCGFGSLDVYVRPRVAILSTGDELVPVDREPDAGQIRNSSGPMLAAMVAATGGDPWVLAAAADRDDALDRAIAEAADADLLLVTGGVSAGKFDLVEPALARADAALHFTGVRIQPGKPLVFGEMPRQSGNGRRSQQGRDVLPIFGLPGNPVSSAVTFLLFAAPVLVALTGSNDTAPRFALARLGAVPERLAKTGLTRFLPARCTFGRQAAQLPEVSLVPWQGSGDLVALARSNCFLVLPEDGPAPEPGAVVRILLS
jgi:molybdopterin molybdotransferase